MFAITKGGKMKSVICKVLVISSALVLANCAQEKVRKEVDAEVKAEPVHTQAGDLAKKSYLAIENSPSLSTEQKTLLTHLIDQARAENRRLNDEDSKIKGVLIEALTAKQIKSAQVDELKGRLRKVADAKIKNTMKTISQMQSVLGVTETEAREDIYRELLFERPGTRE
jgi:hypothetical protein